MYKYPLIVLLIFLFLGACSSSPSNDAIYYKKFNFSNVQSYSIYPRNSEFTETQNISDSQRNGIEIAIEKAMDHQNFQYAPLDEADVVVTYHILSGKPDEYSRYNKAVLFCQHCLKASTWHQSSKAIKLTRGSLVIDLIDPKKKRSVWRNAQELKIKAKDNSREANEKIQQAVKIMLQQYPTRAVN